MKEDKTLLFLKRVHSYKKKCFGCVSFIPIVTCSIVFIMLLSILLFSSSSTPKEKYLPSSPSYTKPRRINTLPQEGECDMEQLAYLTNKCLQQSIIEGRTGHGYESSPQEKECVRYLKSDPRLVTLMSAYIDMVHNDICSYPDYAHQKSVEWFNRPLYYNHQRKKPSL